MQNRDPIPPFDQTGTFAGVCVADGHGIKIRVERRHLIVEDGIGRSRRERRFHKATANFNRLIILGTTGYISLEAHRWLADAGIAFAHLTPGGEILMHSHQQGSDRSSLRRAQSWAVTNETGLEIVRYLPDRKLEGQAHIAAELGGERASIDEARHQIESADSVDELMWLEASAANHYWYAWTDVRCRFVELDLSQVPDHWLVFGKRGSVQSSSPRRAICPIDAILNYLYGLAETEAIFACLAVGLDPGIGVLHADQKARASFALDLMEPVRPLIDERVLELLQDHHFRASDFAETRRGGCRLTPHLTHWLAETAIEWGRALAPHAEHVARQLAATPGIRIDRIPTPLTGENRSLGRPPRPKKPASQGGRRPNCCERCGTPLKKGRRFCEPCLGLLQNSHLKEMVGRAHEQLATLRHEGVDPAHGGEAASKRGESVAVNNRKSYEWNRTNARLDPRIFSEEILPILRDVTLSVMSEATGLSKGYCSFIKRGIKVPHERHWDTMRDLGY